MYLEAASFPLGKKDVIVLKEGAKIILVQCGISFTTTTHPYLFSTTIPDMDTFLTLCDWLEVPPAEPIKNTDNKEAINTPEAIAILLQSDQTLDPTIANALALIIKAALP